MEHSGTHKPSPGEAALSTSGRDSHTQKTKMLASHTTWCSEAAPGSAQGAVWPQRCTSVPLSDPQRTLYLPQGPVRSWGGGYHRHSELQGEVSGGEGRVPHCTASANIPKAQNCAHLQMRRLRGAATGGRLSSRLRTEHCVGPRTRGAAANKRDAPWGSAPRFRNSPGSRREPHLLSVSVVSRDRGHTQGL